jgi:hypothetical protein
LDVFESVCEITGIAIPAYLEYIKTGKITIYNELLKINKLPPNIQQFPLSPDQLLLLANYWSSYKSKFIFKTFQIQNYDWLSQELLDQSITNLNSLNISENAIFEKEYKFMTNTLRLFGSIDCMDDNAIYVFKCCQKIEKEHIIQLALYMFLYLQQPESTPKQFFLFNIITNQLIQINSSLALLEQMTNYIIQYKYGNRSKLDDDSFLLTCKK